MRVWGFVLSLSLFFSHTSAQNYSRLDSLRGSLSEHRSFDVHHYDLDISLDTFSRSIEGSVLLLATAEKVLSQVQLDLAANMKIGRILHNGKKLKFSREGDVVFIRFKSALPAHQLFQLSIEYSGVPREAVRPPWDGGFIWSYDQLGRRYVGVACEGEGASIWWPCKDHPSDEVDSLRIKLTVPGSLRAICNGQLQREEHTDKLSSYTWSVSNPINNYNVTFNVGQYSKIEAEFINEQGQSLPLSYYVWKGNEEKAKEHFTQVQGMLSCFESHFGPYPYYSDGYALVESSYWGMEHQSAIAYGNKYLNNDFGFDFIIIHESGHEWFGNSISVSDHADLWIHESFTTYAEYIYLECTQGMNEVRSYMNQQKARIAFDAPMQGPRGVNFTDHSIDIYFKGAWMLHTLRESIANDSLWFEALRSFYNRNKHSVIGTEKVVSDFSELLSRPLEPFFNQYLNHSAAPVLLYTIKETDSTYLFKGEFKCEDEAFDIPVLIEYAGESQLYPMHGQEIVFEKHVISEGDVAQSPPLIRTDRMLIEAVEKRTN